jgi:predicted phosphodiesterase
MKVNKSEWSEVELKYLKESLAQSDTIANAVDRFRGPFPKKSIPSVRSKIQSLGLKPSGEKPTVEERSKVETLKDQVKKLQNELDDAHKEILASDRMLEFSNCLKDADFSEIPSWLAASKGKKHLTGIPVLFLSDIHFDEYVDSKQIGGVNSYSREIATKRIQHTFNSAIDLCLNHMHNPKYDGAVVALGGDLLSGNIHEELAETNEAPILESAIELTELLYHGISMMAERFGKVFVPCVVGNHGRLHKKPRAKNRVKDNYEWAIYKNLAYRFKSDKRVTFLISDSSDALFSIYEKKILLTHGDQFRGGSGISGIFSPLFIGRARKQQRNQAVNQGFDIMMLGHWHQYIHTDSLIINGSIKGYDEYAYQSNFGFERPQQALFIVHPTLGVTYRMPVLCDSYAGGNSHGTAPLQVWTKGA